MSLLNYIITKLESGLITFINAVTLANRDYPYHDYAYFNDESTETKYTVGDNQIKGRGDQRKEFVSKSTLIYSTVDITLRFNSANNVGIDILASTWYEFKSNIYQIFFGDLSQFQGIMLYLYFEGVLPSEQRGAK
jgi:hypothetical protein